MYETNSGNACLEPKCAELKIMCKRQELLFLDRRRKVTIVFLTTFLTLISIGITLSRQTEESHNCIFNYIFNPNFYWDNSF
jgi:hypothetical protein